MKKLLFASLLLVLAFGLVACGGSKEAKADYTTAQAEKALNDGKDLEGKTIKIKVDKLEPSSAFGYNIQTGKHLNFVSSENPKVKEGDELVVKVTKVESVVGSFVIDYEKQ